MGDAILAFFGAPVAHEDDPQRAVMAGLDILDGIQPYKEEVRARWGLDFEVRVGINTGLVVVGEVGSDLRMEYTALGDAINVAARMEQTA
jgi:class 3 adenylate cyclase